MARFSALPAIIAVSAQLAGCAGAGPERCDKDYAALIESELGEIKAAKMF